MDEEVYVTHVNGGRPFLVRITGRRVRVYRERATDAEKRVPRGSACAATRPPTEDELAASETAAKTAPTYEDEPCFDRAAARIFVGVSPDCDFTHDDGGSPGTDGNSLLLYMGKGEGEEPHEYVLIGGAIESFKTADAIIKYVSPIGNSDVPYPFAYDGCGRAYALDGLGVSFPLTSVLLTLLEVTGDMYAMYDRVSTIVEGEVATPRRTPLYPRFRGIVGYRVRGVREELMYRPAKWGDEAVETAMRHAGVEDGGVRVWPETALEYADGTAAPLSPEGYAKLMEEFGEMSGIRRLETTMIVECPY